MNKQMCVGTDQRMLEKWMQYCCLDTGLRISLQMFVILAYPGKGRILSQKRKQKISVSTSLLLLSKTALIACLLVISTI